MRKRVNDQRGLSRECLLADILVGLALICTSKFSGAQESPVTLAPSLSPAKQTQSPIVTSLQSSAEAGTASPKVSSRRALLIGCANYPHLPSRYSLRGPTNDVRLFSHVLRSRLGFSEDQITRLWQGTPSATPPTREAIETAFTQLIEQAHPGQDIVILLAGHGSQQPLITPQLHEPDGMDEVFLPVDISTWRKGAPVNNAITDNQIHEWLTQLRDKGAFVFFVADCCHSGTLARGAEEFVTRHVPPDLLWAPRTPTLTRWNPSVAALPRDTLLDQSQAAQAKTRANSGGFVALYAVPANALEVEERMPPDGDEQSTAIHGRLTYALCESLQRTNGPFSYRELTQRIRQHYERWPWLPYYQIEGDALDRQVLGPSEWPGRSSLILNLDDQGSGIVSAGMLHGLTRSSILSVHPPVGAKPHESVLGYVRVSEITPISARVEPVAWQGQPAVSLTSYPHHARCQVAQFDYGDLKLRVAVAALSGTESGTGRTGTGGTSPHGVSAKDDRLHETLKRVGETLKAICQQPDSLTRLVTTTDRPDVLVLVTDDHRMIVRQAGDVPGDALQGHGSFGPFSISASQNSELTTALRRLSRAIQLRRLADQFRDPPLEDESLGSRLKIEVAPYQLNSRGKPGALGEPLAATNPFVFRGDDRIAVRVTNQQSSPVDITVLYINGAWQIQSFFPTRKQAGLLDNRLHGQGDSAIAYFHISDDVVGPEDVVVIATRADPGSPPAHFAHLEQEGLPVADQVRDGSPNRSPSLLENLLQRSLYGVGDLRGGRPQEMRDFSMERIRWNIIKQPEDKRTISPGD
jgi:hypothetical protein